MQRKKTTSEVAQVLGLDHQVLINYLGRYPELRPSERLPNQDYLWSDAEIEQLVVHRSAGKRGKRRILPQ